ncbi:cupin domain-containing protein [Acidiphilium acidophilum]|uniref:cupin domain-containing protein n=1 Tax=Acidiphilium acidophilum TaxID=76588 RepID=UPI002E8E614C|nr:cupin domain-containing protein [Acidiphilium acidophilum]
MQINADLTRPAIVDSTTLDWVPSPIAGIERRMLERDGAEVARATSLVRYAPGTAFSPHRHDAGEEFLVLDGVFSDETGDFPEGYYIRNPPGSRHTPASAPGAIILVKLRQMPEAETQPLRIDTRNPALWHPIAEGLEHAMLFDAPWEQVDLLRLAPGHTGAPETFPGGVEIFIVTGSATIDDHPRSSGTWLRFPPGATLRLASAAGATIYRKTGHLAAQ